MGIRVNKYLGWGLVDVAFNTYTLTDPRINTTTGILGPDGWKDRRYTDVTEYRAWLDTRTAPEGEELPSFEGQLIDMVLRDDEHKPPHQRRGLSPRDAITWEAEYGLGTVLCIRPLTHTDWHRHDDAIDWTEETYLKEPIGENVQDWVRVLPEAPYPHNGLYMNAWTGEGLRGAQTLDRVLMWRRLWWHDHLHVEDALSVEQANAVTGELFGLTWTEAESLIVPRVPIEIRDLVRFGELFTDDTVWRQLRPILYCRWG